MLLSISDKLTDDNVKNLKFMCQPDIGKKRLEKINTGIELFECLIERAAIGPDNTGLLRKLLNDIGQAVLLEIVEDYERYATRSTDGLDPKEREKIDIATEVIVEQLGRKWLQVGRKLGLQQTHLEGIQEKHSRDLEEQVRELIRQWMKIRRENARVDELLKALRDCKQNLTADLVEKKLRESQNSL